ncbi:MAG: hypothetical protein R2761_17915 [Acidimicrobiales bacterium]
MSRPGDETMAAALAHVRLTQVVDRATDLVRRKSGDGNAPAITTGAVYNLWPTQAEFQADLLLHIADIQATLTVDVERGRALYQASAAAGVPVGEVLRVLVNRVQRLYRGDALFAVVLGFGASAVDPRVQQALRHRQDAFLALAEPTWQSLLDAYDLRLCPPYTIRHLALAVAAQFVGSVVQFYANPEIDADPAGEEGWSLTARSITAVFQSMTMPADGPAGR